MSVSLTRCAWLFNRHFVHYLLSESRAAIALGRAKKVPGGLEARPFIPGDGYILL